MASQALKAHAETATELATATLKFKDYVPEDGSEIAATVSELFAISSELLALAKAIRNPENASDVEYCYEDQRVVVLSLEYTFKDMEHQYGGVKQRGFRTNQDAYYTVWNDMQMYFKSESQNTLLTRLGYYRDILNDLTYIVEGTMDFTPATEDMLHRFTRLLDIQKESRLAPDFNNLQIGPPKQKSWERRKPVVPSKAKPGPLEPVTPPLRSTSRRRPSKRRLASPLPPEFEEWRPSAPTPPLRPVSPSTTTGTTSTASSYSPALSSDHWLRVAFGLARPTTTFEITGQESGCYGENQAGASHKLKVDHDQLLSLPFDKLELRFYHRSSDRRARIWCRMDRGGRRSQCVQTVASLRIQRKDSALQLCKQDSRSNKLLLWANLKFSSYERMVLFHCSFLALKAQDEAQPVQELDDHILHGEIPVWSGKILDDNYQHALQIFKDENSGGIRLQASVLRGSMKRCPVWVAFITYKVQAREWIKRAEKKKINLLELTRFVFSYEYQPQQGPNGEEQIHFLNAKDADSFEEAIDDLGEGKI